MYQMIMRRSGRHSGRSIEFDGSSYRIRTWVWEQQDVVVGVSPSGAFTCRSRLFAALEEVFDVGFEPRDAGSWRGLDAAIAFASSDATESSAWPAGIPYLLLSGYGASLSRERSEGTVAFTRSPRLDPRLRERRTVERAAPEPPALPVVGGELLATYDGRPMWISHDDAGARRDVAAVAPDELGPGDTLRNHLRAGSFLELLPVVHFLRQVTGYWSWNRPRQRATFLFDDPNLHWPSYGFLRFAELANHARRHGHHVGIATVPLDAWFVHPKAARIARESGTHLSFNVHGNDHVYRELAPLEHGNEDAIALQALQRVRRLERRAGIRVGRVMIPPHGQYGERMLGALARTGFEALCGDFPPPWWLENDGRERLPGSWRPAELGVSGLPIITRYSFNHPHPDDEFLFWLLLDRPIVLYGHHADLADGLDVLERQAEEVNRLGDTTWMSLEAIAQSNFITRRTSDVVHVRIYSRRAELAIPDDVSWLVVEVPRTAGSDDYIELEGQAVPLVPNRFGRTTGRVPVELLAGTTANLRQGQVRVVPDAWRRSRLVPILRRSVGESRDRMRPLIRTVGLDPLLRRLEDGYERQKARRRK
jgi:hypothetical protein